jgi:hypothetical protein
LTPFLFFNKFTAKHKLLVDIDVYISLKTHKNPMRAFERESRSRNAFNNSWPRLVRREEEQRRRAEKGFTRISFANFYAFA